MTEIDKTIAVSIYKMSVLIRRTQEILIQEYTAKQEMRCPMHFCVGQEAAPAALSPLLRPDDYLVSHYRSHGYYLAKGAPLREMIAEFHGKASGSNSGNAGSMELGHEESHFFSGAIVGGPIGIATGTAFAMKYRGVPAVTVCAIGEGSLDEGVSYEALNLAALKAVPLLVICENNLYAAHTPLRARTVSESLIDRVKSFGMHAEELETTDMVKVFHRLAALVGEVRSGSGPRFIEIKTYRYCSHVGPENDDWLEYRSAEEIAAQRERDPIPLLRAQLLSLGLPDEKLREIESKVEAEIYAAIEEARRAEFPQPGQMLTQVRSNTYSKVIKEFTPGRASFDGRQVEMPLKPF
jgi:TPP-dependent pyruvate/acetoin dehydrogenase alpha subunit